MVNGVRAALPAELCEGASEQIEVLIGRQTAMAASLIAAEVQEWQNGGTKPATARQAADAIAMLFELRAATLATGELEPATFEMVARTEGIRALRPLCNNSDGLLASLVGGVLEILSKVVASQVN
jgi:hypothetical protein